MSMRRARSALATGVVIAVLAAVVYLATQADGREASRATSNDGGAWMADRGQGGIAHIEFETGEPSVTILIENQSGSLLSVKQSDQLTMVHDRTSSVVSIIDDANGGRRSKTGVPIGSTVRPLGSDLAVHDPATQRTWLTSATEFGQAEEIDEIDPLTSGQLDHLLVSRSGKPVTIGADRRVKWLRSESEPATLPAGTPIEHASMTGDMVVAVSAGEWVTVNEQGGTREIVGVNAPAVASMQQESGNYPYVGYLADDGGLIVLDGNSGGVQRLAEAPGTAVQRPIMHQGCLYVLMQVAGSIRSDAACLDGRTASALNAVLPQISPEAELRLVNGRVLIDEVDGSGWIYTPDLMLEEVENFSAAFDETEDREDDTSDDIREEFDQSATDAELTEADKSREEENVAPVAEDDVAATRLGRPVVVDVLANDFDDNGDVLLIEGVELLQGTAEIEIASNGTTIQVTALGGVEDIRFSYRINDGRGPDSTATANVRVSVLPDVEVDNRPPVAQIDRLVGAAGTVLTVNLTGNDMDPDGDSIVLTAVDTETDVRVLSIHPDGDALVVLPSTVIEGEVTVPYLVKDEWGATAEGELRVTVRLDESNVPPDARNDTAVAHVGQRIVLDLLVNDVDGDGDVLRATQARSLSGDDIGFVSTSTGGEFTFEPNRAGTFLFEYDATDKRAKGTAQIRIEVREESENRAPLALRDDVVLALGETRLVRSLENDGDPDGDLIGIIDQSNNPNLDVVVQQGVGFFVTMKAGADTIERFTYRVSDGALTSDLATVVVARSDVAFQDAPPVAIEDSLRVRAGRRSALRVLRNDYDPEGGPLVIETLDASSTAIGTETGSQGQWFEVDVPIDQILPFNVIYSVVDEAGNTDAATVELTIVPADEINSPPTARLDRAYTIDQTAISIEVLANDTDPESDPISLTTVIPSSPLGGTAEVNDELTGFVYQPLAGFYGTDRFSYVIRDSEGAESVGFVEVGVMPQPLVNTDPVANPDLDYEFVAGTGEVALPVLENDIDFDGDPLTVIEVRGSAAARTIGEGILLELPEAAREASTIALTYAISDGRGGTDQTEVAVVVLPNVDPIPPTAEPDLVGPVKEGDEVPVEVVANDTDPDDDDENLVVSIDPAIDYASLDPLDPQVVVLTAPGESVQIPYTITDVDGGSASSTIELRVEPNLGPVVQQTIAFGEFFTDEPIPVIDLSAYVTDPEGDELVFSNVSAQVGGTTRLDESSSDARLVTFEPDADFEGEAGFVFTVIDPFGNEATGRFTLTLLGKSNQAPVGTDQSIVIEAGVSQPFDLLSLFEDPDEADVVTVEILASPSGPLDVVDLGLGRIEIGADVTADAWNGVYQIQAADPEGLTAQANLQIDLEVSSIGPPVAGQDEAETNQGETIQVNVLANDSDTLGEGDLKIISTFVDAQAGTTTNSTDTVTFTPEPSFFGTATIQYRIADARNRAEGEADGLLIVEVIGRPDAPAGLAVSSVGPTDITLTWQVPANNGAPIDGYKIRVSNDEGLPEEIHEPAGSSPSYRFTDRVPGVEYRFEVLAANRAGEGEYSSSSPPIKPDAVAPPPGKPDVAFTQTPGQLAISWTEPPPGDYSAIGRYFLEISGCTSSVIDVGLALEWTWDGLTNGERCTFRAYAENEKVRDGAEQLWSPSSDPECPVDVPEPANAPAAVRGDKEATITWSQPVNPDCEEIIGYEIRRFRDGSLDATREVDFGVVDQLFGGLQNGSSYSFDVRAQNRQGWGAYSARSIEVIPCGPPLAPPAPSGVRGDQLVTVTSGGPAPANGCVVTQYQIRITPGAQIVSLAGEPANTVLDSLVNGTPYTFEVRGVNEINTGDWSAPSAAVTPAGLPIGGSIVTTTRGPEEYGWRIDGADGNGAPLQSYSLTGAIGTLEFTSVGGPVSGLCINAQNNPCEPTGGTTQQQESCDQHVQTVTVTGFATNNVGNGPTITESLQLDGCPIAPSVTSLTAQVSTPTSGEYEVRWSLPADTDELYVERDGGAWDGPLSGTSKTYTASTGQSATVRVWACNEFGCRSSGTESVTVPQPAITITWGNLATPERQDISCPNSGECRHIQVTWSDFPATGTWQIDCVNGTGVWFAASGFASGSSGYFYSTCVIQPGFQGPTWVEIGGLESNRIS